MVAQADAGRRAAGGFARQAGSFGPPSMDATASTRAACTASPMAGPACAAGGRLRGDDGGVHRQRGRVDGAQARPLRVRRVRPARAARARRTRRRAGSRRAVPACGTRRSVRAAAPARRRRTRRCGGRCRARAPPPRPARGSRWARAGAPTTGAPARRCAARGRDGAAARRAGVLPLPRSWPRQAKRTASGSLEPRAHVEHHHQVHAGVDLGVVVGALRHAPQAVDLGQQARQRAAAAQHLEHARRPRLHQAAGELLPDALGHQRIDIAVVDHPSRQRERLVGDLEVGEARREARQAQDAHRILGERRRDVAQHAARPGRAGRRRGRSRGPSSSCAIALIVRSRRDRSCSSVTSGAAWNAKPW